jgi:hypothetical protein
VLVVDEASSLADGRKSTDDSFSKRIDTLNRTLSEMVEVLPSASSLATNGNLQRHHQHQPRDAATILHPLRTGTTTVQKTRQITCGNSRAEATSFEEGRAALTTEWFKEHPQFPKNFGGDQRI